MCSFLLHESVARLAFTLSEEFQMIQISRIIYVLKIVAKVTFGGKM
jgi:hypothetical protein